MTLSREIAWLHGLGLWVGDLPADRFPDVARSDQGPPQWRPNAGEQRAIEDLRIPEKIGRARAADTVGLLRRDTHWR